MVVRRTAVITAVTCIGLCVLGYVAAVTEMLATGAVGLALVAADGLAAILVPLPSSMTRTAHHRRTSVGRPVDVTATVTWSRWRPRRSFRLIEHVDGVPLTPLTVEPDRSEPTTTVDYRVTPTHRGIVPLGPLLVESIPILGALTMRRSRAPIESLIVHPETVELLPMVSLVGASRGLAGSPPMARHEPDMDPGPLRPYVIGDDVRRIHWPSTARSNEVIVRTDDPPVEDVPLVLVDPRTPDDDGSAVEHTLAFAASVLTAQRSERRPAEFLCLSETAPIDVADERGLIEALDVLAMVVPTAEVPSREAIRRHVSTPRTVVLCSAVPDDVIDASARAMLSLGADVILVAFSGEPAGPTARAGDRRSLTTVFPGPDPAAAWNELMTRRRSTLPSGPGVAAP